MSGIAEIMHNIGFKVQGSDPSRNNKNIKRYNRKRKYGRLYKIKQFHAIETR